MAISWFVLAVLSVGLGVFQIWAPDAAREFGWPFWKGPNRDARVFGVGYLLFSAMLVAIGISELG